MIVWIIVGVVAVFALLAVFSLVRGSMRVLRDDEPAVSTSWGKQVGGHKDDDEHR